MSLTKERIEEEVVENLKIDPTINKSEDEDGSNENQNDEYNNYQILKN